MQSRFPNQHAAVRVGGQRACACADGGGELCSAQPGEHGARAAAAAGVHSGLPESNFPRRINDWCPKATQHADLRQVMPPRCRCSSLLSAIEHDPFM